ncbi:hypothetical protein SteCoe_35997 [Stentor coeruleus]|uniref:Uncharacterized protein n=1 Tax=Stentor coeruleus TaxID=5963 RepID=A0A1R2AR13_9CILI|nr:hypothetical protein SteCoe_35997 [Stentor coeruleus]
MKYLCLLALLVIAMSSDMIYNLDNAETVYIPVNGKASMKISTDADEKYSWVPSRYQPKLEFENLSGEIVYENDNKFKIFIAKCTDKCVENDFFLISMSKPSKLPFGPPIEHAVPVSITSPV